MTSNINRLVLMLVSFGYASLLYAQVPAAPLIAQTPLPWAFALNTPGLNIPIDDGQPKHVPNSTLAFVFTTPRNLYNPPDWHPADHPPMPPIVASGRNPGVFACAYCHLPNAQGRPENASLAGLPADYIMQQMRDYRAGLRKSSEPQMGPPANMLIVGMTATEAEAAEAATYFSSLTLQPWIRVIETDTVPETVISGSMFIEKEGGGMEALGNRIVEMPEDLELTELRDSHSGFIAYVPVGSIERGKALAAGTGDLTPPCAFCHGDTLQGLGPIPALAGRSPSYIARQLWDLKMGNRKGLWSPLMAAVVANLTPDNIVDIAAYTASLEP
jgi:cytochrome c553